MSMLLDKNSQLTSLSLRYEIMAQKYWMFPVFILTTVTGIALVIGEPKSQSICEVTLLRKFCMLSSIGM